MNAALGVCAAAAWGLTILCGAGYRADRKTIRQLRVRNAALSDGLAEWKAESEHRGQALAHIFTQASGPFGASDQAVAGWALDGLRFAGTDLDLLDDEAAKETALSLLYRAG